MVTPNFRIQVTAGEQRSVLIQAVEPLRAPDPERSFRDNCGGERTLRTYAIPILPRPHPSTPGGGDSTKCLLVDPPTDRRTTPATLLPRPGGCRRGSAAFLIALLISSPSFYLNDMSGS